MVYYSKLKIVFLCINVNEQQQQKECNMLKKKKKHTKLPPCYVTAEASFKTAIEKFDSDFFIAQGFHLTGVEQCSFHKAKASPSPEKSLRTTSFKKVNKS